MVLPAVPLAMSGSSLRTGEAEGDAPQTKKKAKDTLTDWRRSVPCTGPRAVGFSAGRDHPATRSSPLPRPRCPADPVTARVCRVRAKDSCEWSGARSRFPSSRGCLRTSRSRSGRNRPSWRR